MINLKIYRCVMLAVLFCLPCPAFAAQSKPEALSLKDSIALALERNLILQTAHEMVLASASQKQEAFTGFLPKFSTSYSYTRLNTDPWFPFSGMKLPAGTKDNFTWAFEVKQPLFAGGAINAGYRLNSLGLTLARHEEKAGLLDVVQQVKETYFGIIKAEHLREVARQSVKTLEAHHKNVQALFVNDLAARNEVLHVDVELANAQKLLIQAGSGVEMAKSQLNTILRRDINTPVEVEDIAGLPPFDASLETCLKTAEEQRPEIKAAEIKIKQNDQLLAIEKSQYYPNVGVLGHAERFGESPSLKGSEFKDQDGWLVAAQASWTFWEWGKTRDRVQARQAYGRAAMHGREMLKDQVRLEVKQAYLAVIDARKQVEVAEKAVKQAEENYRINRMNYQEQLATNTDVLDAQTLLVKTRTDLVNAQADYHLSLARLERCMGVLNT